MPKSDAKIDPNKRCKNIESNKWFKKGDWKWLNKTNGQIIEKVIEKTMMTKSDCENRLQESDYRKVTAKSDWKILQKMIATNDCLKRLLKVWKKWSVKVIAKNDCGNVLAKSTWQTVIDKSDSLFFEFIKVLLRGYTCVFLVCFVCLSFCFCLWFVCGCLLMMFLNRFPNHIFILF